MISNVLKNIRMFAVLNILRGGLTRQASAGIFYALADRILYGFVPPCWSVNAPTASKVLSNGKGETVFLFSPAKNKFFRMLNRRKICSGVNYNIPLTTDSTRHVETLLSILSLAKTHPKTAAVLLRLKCMLEDEYNAKQRAYNFIAEKGLIAEFCGVKTGKKRNLKKRV